MNFFYINRALCCHLEVMTSYLARNRQRYRRHKMKGKKKRKPKWLLALHIFVY